MRVFPENKFQTVLHRALGTAFFVALLLSTNQLFAQPTINYHEKESNNIRIDPEWARTYDSGGFLWAYDVQTDAHGNVYSTGYFKSHLGGKNLSIIPQQSCQGTCPDSYFLMKHDSDGNLLWARYAIGNARPAKIAIDKKGNVYAAGTVYSKGMEFSDSDSAFVKLNKPDNYNAGIFIAKYSPNGKIISTYFYGDKDEYANDFLIDKKGNLFVAGNYNFRNADKPGEVKRSFFLAKFSPDYRLLWKQAGDTIGISAINGIHLDRKGNIFATGGYGNNLRIGNTELISRKSDSRPFLSKFNGKGNLVWVTDSVGQQNTGAGQGVVTDKKGNAYLFVNGAYSTNYFAKINSKGEPQWVQSIKGRMSNANQKILIDKEDNIYLGGEGYGAVFGSAGPELQTFKSKGNYDFYFAKYNTDGVLLWLKAGGGKQLDYCKSIAIYKNDFYAFGWLNGGLTFKDSVLSNRGGAFWLAKFDLKKLEQTDKGPQKPEAPKLNPEEHFSFNKITCDCYQPVEKHSGYMSLVYRFAPYKNFSKTTGLQLAGDTSLYSNIFFKKLQASPSHDESFYSLTAVGFSPLKIWHPNKTFTYNFTPCKSNEKFWELPLTYSYRHPIKRYINGFDHETFDRSATSYFDVLVNRVGVDYNVLLDRLLFQGEEDDITPFLKKINKKYKTHISINPESEDDVVATIVQALEAKSIDVGEFILDEFILTNKQKRPVNQEEANRLESLFREFLGGFSLKDLDGIIYPQHRATIDTKTIGVELSEGIIRQWDAVKNKAITAKKGQFVPAIILAEVPEVTFETSKGFKAATNQICIPRAEISDTGILLWSNNARLINNPKELSSAAARSLSFPFPEITSQPRSTHQPAMRDLPAKPAQPDTSLTGFTGLFLPEASFSFPYKNTRLLATGQNIYLNNFFISGSVVFPADGLPASGEMPSEINLIRDGGTITTSPAELEKELHKTGLNEVKLANENGTLRVYFKKVNKGF